MVRFTLLICITKKNYILEIIQIQKGLNTERMHNEISGISGTLVEKTHFASYYPGYSKIKILMIDLMKIKFEQVKEF